MKHSLLLLLIAISLLVTLPLIINHAKITANGDQRVAMVFGSSGSVLGDGDSEPEHEEEQEEEEEVEDEKEEYQEDEESSDQDHEQEQDRQESHTEETIKSANGTTTYIKRESDDEKTEIELKTYDANGRLIEERKLKQESEEGEDKELELEQYLFNEGNLQELTVKNSQDRELKIEVREKEEGSDSASKIEYDATKQILKINYEEQNRHLYVSLEEDHFLLDDGKQKARVDLPLTIDSESGEVFANTVVGLIRIAVSPDRAREIIELSQEDIFVEDDQFSLELDGNGLEYKISVKKQERLFGLFPITVETAHLVNAETGKLSGEQQDFITSLLDLLSV